ncbi:DUF167 family protein [Methylosinus sp. Sm6]|uniref:DUF167 family protein n=1 Tax=Methylosinus sp. Sm6 TaxID=2866948 RepID=UPI001C99D18F|nr:DUF167 family protein [Methylosinus sp. Sm6]MBY6239775.1 DUF167 family protein [Methylosinus sp. Sm6]
MSDPKAWSVEGEGVALWVRLTPKGGRDALAGVETLADGRAVLKARVRAAPEDGRANEALVALIAAALGAPKRSVQIASGHTARLKKLFIAGDPASLVAALEKSGAKNDG